MEMNQKKKLQYEYETFKRIILKFFANLEK